MKILTIISLILASINTFAQNYAVSTISPELKENAHSIVRLHQTEFFVKNIGEATTKVKAAITILDEKGDDHADLYLVYDKFTKINDLDAVIYNEVGKQVKKLKRADIENFSGSGENLATDNHIRVAHLSYPIYPYTIAYSYETTTKNMLFYPTWSAILDNDENTSVEQASFMISTPTDMTLRFKEQNMPQKSTIYGDADHKVWSWKVQNLKAIELEPNSPPASLIMPMVFTAPSDFKIEDYVGNVNSWQDLAKFYGDLNKDRDNLPSELNTKISDLANREPTKEKKIKAIYEYLQTNTRYVSIQLGIGGWQTFRAEEVASKGYGDCKALTNYMKSMLKSQGILAYPVLVKSGERKQDIHSDFPSFQFNHVILCVPNQKDSLWLECTSQSGSAGYLGSFTGDRHALLINENGGNLIKTPTYQTTDNQQVRNANVILSENSEAQAIIKTLYKGEQSETPSGIIHEMNKEEQKKYLLKALDLPSVEINDFSFSEKKDKIPSVNETLNLSIRNIANKSGSRIFLTPNLLNQNKSVPIANPNRKNDFVQGMNYMDTDSIFFQIPPNYKVEFLTEPYKIQAKYGSYSSNTSQKDDKILYVRELIMNKGQYPAAEYAQWVDFRKKIVKADKMQVILVQKQ